jgi:hypothetical protein
VTYYGVLGAARQNLHHTIMVFDLGGISHFAKQDAFPVSWTAPETDMLTASCYRPTEWDIYRTEPCDFVMERLKKENLFGSPILRDAWMRAIANHPVAYLQHRAALMGNFLMGENFTMWTQDLDNQSQAQLPDRLAFAALISIHDALKPTPLFRVGSWLLACMAICAFAWRRRATPGGAFAIGVCGSASIYVLSYFAIGVGSDFRYGYWAVLASIAGGVMALSPQTGEMAPGAGSRQAS